MKISPIEVKLINHCGDDLSVVNAARVSFEKESDWGQSIVGEPTLKDGDIKLISYLAKHKHFSPFNHAFLSFRVKAPIFVARQLVKHKFMPWNEVSRRYVDSEPEFYMPDLRLRAANVKQGSQEEVAQEMPWGVFIDMPVGPEDYMQIGLDLYADAIRKGVAPEVARAFLPQNMMTEWLWSGTLGAFADMLHLRLDPHSQKESRDVAKLIYEQALPLFPVSLKALLENK